MKTPRCNHFTVFCIDESPTNEALHKAVKSIGGTIELMELSEAPLRPRWDHGLHDSELGVIEARLIHLFETSKQTSPDVVYMAAYSGYTREVISYVFATNEAELAEIVRSHFASHCYTTNVTVNVHMDRKVIEVIDHDDNDDCTDYIILCVPRVDL
jgi:hypothetical protein